MAEYHEILYMEHSEGSRNESPPHSSRTEANKGRAKERNDRANKEAETEWHGVSTTHQNKGGHILYLKV